MSDSGTPPSAPTGPNTTSTIFSRLAASSREKPLDLIMNACRAYTVVQFFLCVLMPTQTNYQGVIMGSLASNMMRAYQRVGAPKFSSAFLQSLLAEDAGHYLLYSFIFLSRPPSLIVTIPPAVFALFALASFIKYIAGPGRVAGLMDRLLGHQAYGFEMVATCEISLLFVAIFQAITQLSLSGFMNIMVLLQFLQLRYLSKRNPYSRLAWGKLHTLMLMATSHRLCPAAVRNLYISLTQKLDMFVEALRRQAHARAQQQQPQPQAQ